MLRPELLSKNIAEEQERRVVEPSSAAWPCSSPRLSSWHTHLEQEPCAGQECEQAVKTSSTDNAILTSSKSSKPAAPTPRLGSIRVLPRSRVPGRSTWPASPKLFAKRRKWHGRWTLLEEWSVRESAASEVLRCWAHGSRDLTRSKKHTKKATSLTVHGSLETKRAESNGRTGTRAHKICTCKAEDSWRAAPVSNT